MREGITTQHDSDIFVENVTNTLDSIPQTANLASEKAVDEDALASEDVTDLSAGNMYNNNARLNKPKLPPIKGMTLATQRKIDSRGKSRGSMHQMDAEAYQALIDSDLGMPATSQRQNIILNVQTKASSITRNNATGGTQVRPRSKH